MYPISSYALLNLLAMHEAKKEQCTADSREGVSSSALDVKARTLT